MKKKTAMTGGKDETAMNETVKRQLTDAGILVDEVLERFMGNEKLLVRMLGKFTADENFAQLTEAVESRDTDKALRASHTLKGMCANLSIAGLAALFTEQVELLRAGREQEAFDMMPRISHAYEQTVQAINSMGQQ